MKSLKGIGLLILTNILIMITLIISGTVIVNFVLPMFGIDVRQSFAAMNMTWSLVFGFGGAFISLFMSKWMAKRGAEMQQITSPSTPKEKLVYETVQSLAQREGINMPEVWVYWDDVPNAFATGPSRNNSMVAVSSGLAMNLTDDELKAVLAHEMGHIANGDMLATTLLQGLMNTFVYFIARMISEPVKERNFWAGFALDMFLQVALAFLAMIPITWFSRHREFGADAYAADAVGAPAMISALRKIEALSNQSEAYVNAPEEDDALATMKIYAAHSKLTGLFATHPPIEARIEALQHRR
ncbi:MAG: protease HtpX [Mariprofundaceae bacterium]|nr:protease HtpX [Mariprofundaceae bacterium]